MSSFADVVQRDRPWRSRVPAVAFCAEKKRLADRLLDAIHELAVLHGQQMRAVAEDDPDFSRFDVPLYRAQEEKDKAKYAWIAHVETHGCGEA